MTPSYNSIHQLTINKSKIFLFICWLSGSDCLRIDSTENHITVLHNRKYFYDSLFFFLIYCSILTSDPAKHSIPKTAEVAYSIGVGELG